MTLQLTRQLQSVNFNKNLINEKEWMTKWK